MELKKNLKFNVGDEVVTTTDYDNDGNEVFPTGTKGVIVAVNLENAKYPYRVKAGNENHWFYTDDMLELVKDKVDKSKVFKLVSDVIAETEGDNELLKDVVYYIECYRKREHLK